MGYTSEEIQTSVEKLVLSSISTPYDVLGTRRTDVTFTEIQQAAAGVFLLYFNSPFYVCWLGAQKLLEQVGFELDAITKLRSDVSSTGRRVQPIKDLTPLNNAKAALFELEGAVTSRKAAFKDVTKVPAFQRFVTNTDQFLAATGPAVKQSGDVVATPQEAKGLIPSEVSDLNMMHQELVRRARLLMNGLDDYQDTNLAALVSAGVITRARELVSQHALNLEGMSETQRLTVIRGIILDLLSSKGLVEKYGSLGSIGPYYTVQGSGAPFSDSTHLANPAELDGDEPGAYPIVLEDAQLDLFMDRALVTPQTFSVDVFVPAETYHTVELTIHGGGTWPAGIVAGYVVYVTNVGNTSLSRWIVTTRTTTTLTCIGVLEPTSPEGETATVFPPPDVALTIDASYVASLDGQIAEPFVITTGNCTVVFSFDGTPYPVTLVAPVTMTARGVAHALRHGGSFSDYMTAEAYLAPRKFSGLFNYDGAGTYTRVGGGVSFLDLGIITGDIIVIDGGTDDEVFFGITGVTADTVTIAPFGPAVNNVLAEIGYQYRKVRVRAIDPLTALSNRSTIAADSSTDIYRDALLTLGFAPVISSQCRPSTAKEVCDSCNNQTTRATFTPIFTPTKIAPSPANTDPLNAQKLIFSKLKATVTAVASAFQVFTVNTTGLYVGDKVVVRAGASADVGFVGTIFGPPGPVVGTTINVVFTPHVLTAGSLDIEIGPSPGALPGDMVRIYSGVNTGDYYVTGHTTVPFEILLEQVLPQSSLRAQPVTVSAALGGESISIASADKTTLSSVQAEGPAKALFFSGAARATGTTPWFSVQAPKGLLGGDVLELYQSQYNVPSFTSVVTSVEPNVIGLVTPIPSVFAALSFATDIPVPFARLRIGHVANYDAFADDLSAWLSEYPQQPLWFTDFNRYINPLLSNANPTDGQVRDAQNRLDILSASVSRLEAVLSSYQVDPISAVDTLIKTFRDKGADRAADLLTEGQFSVFFGVTADSSSYAGDFLESVREVARNDMPIRKSNRQDTQNGRLISSAESPDFEYDQSDVDMAPMPDPPADFDKTT